MVSFRHTQHNTDTLLWHQPQDQNLFFLVVQWFVLNKKEGSGLNLSVCMSSLQVLRRSG